MNDKTKDDILLVSPSTIGNLKVIGNILLGIALVGAALLFINAPPANLGGVWHYEFFGFGIALAISGVIQHQLFYGLSSIIEQLFGIRKNTS